MSGADFPPITIRPAEGGGVEVVQHVGTPEEITTGTLNFDEMIGQVIALTAPGRAKAYAMRSPAEWDERAMRSLEGAAERSREVARTILLPLDRDVARSFDDALADVLCWIRGWSAGQSEDNQRNGPTGVERVRDLRILLRNAIASNERANDV